MRSLNDLNLTRVDGTLFKKREIKLCGVDGNDEIILLVYGDDVNKIRYEADVVAKFKNVKVGSFDSHKYLQFTKTSSQIKDELINDYDVCEADQNNKAVEVLTIGFAVFHLKKDLIQAIQQLVDEKAVSGMKISKTTNGFIVENLTQQTPTDEP